MVGLADPVEAPRFEQTDEAAGAGVAWFTLLIRRLFVRGAQSEHVIVAGVRLPVCRDQSHSLDLTAEATVEHRIRGPAVSGAAFQTQGTTADSVQVRNNACNSKSQVANNVDDAASKYLEARFQLIHSRPLNIALPPNKNG